MTTRLDTTFASPLARLRAVPDAVLVLSAYLGSRVLATALLVLADTVTRGWSVSHIDGPPGFLGFLQSWDGKFYAQIAETGYPKHLPTAADGDVAKNPWAFLPLYPVLARAVMATGLGFDVAGPLVALVFGAFATLALYRMLRRFGRTQALWGSVLFAFGPMSFVLQVTYAESVYLFFMFAALAAIIERRYLTALPFAVLAAFAHPGALALAFVLGIAFLRERRPWALLVGVVTGAAGVAWPIIAALYTGNGSAYFDSELAWWSDYLGRVTFVPFTPWFVFAGHYWELFGAIIVAAVLAGFLWWITRPSTRVLGPDVTAYTFGYFAYLVAVFLPQQSMFRMLLPLSPMLGHPALSRTRIRRFVSLGVSVALQPVGVLLFWVIWPP